MLTDGKQLENLVDFVEKQLLPKDFDVQTNRRVYGEDGKQIAEFDLEIRGKVGSTTIAWLIECRDRPSGGPAPGQWIEQLVGRRSRFGFNKVTAVSTTGFAAGASEYAAREGVEVRTVTAIGPEAFQDWLALQSITVFQRGMDLKNASFLLDPRTSQQHQAALIETVSGGSTQSVVLRSSVDGTSAHTQNVFQGVVNQIGTLFDDVVPDGPVKPFRILAEYTDQDHFIVETKAGPIPLKAIEFICELRITTKVLPLSLTAEYRGEDGKSISQLAAFAPHELFGINLAVEMHRISASGETKVILRKVEPKPQEE